jgi:hypothetical protein
MTHSDSSRDGAVSSSPSDDPARQSGFWFDLNSAKAAQEAEWFRRASGTCLFVAGLGAFVAFFLEMRSYFVFGDWLALHDWTGHESLRSFIHWLVDAASMFVFAFGFFGILSLFSNDTFARTLRFVFLLVVVPMLLLPILRFEFQRMLLICGCILLYFASRWMANWFKNQRPRDWRTILKEKRRLGWGPLEFAMALTKARASDGKHLAVMVGPGDPFPIAEGIQEQIESLLREEAYGQLKTVLPPEYESVTTILRLTLKQRFPRARDPKASLLRTGVSEDECKAMSQTRIYAHPEIADRAKPFLG